MLTKVGLHRVDEIGTVASYTASGAAVWMGLTVDEWGIIGVLVGICLGVATFAFNVWFKMKYSKG